MVPPYPFTIFNTKTS